MNCMMIISSCLMCLLVASDLATEIRQGTRHRGALDRTGAFDALSLSEPTAPTLNQFIRTYSSCQAPRHRCLLVHFQFDCDQTLCRIQPIQLKAAYIDTHNTTHNQTDNDHPQGGFIRELEEKVSIEASNEAPGEGNLLSIALTQICQRLGLNCTANSLPLIGPFIEGFIKSGGADFLPKVPIAEPTDAQPASITAQPSESPPPAAPPADSAMDEEMRAAAERLAHSNVRSGSVTLPLEVDGARRLLYGEANPLASLLRLVEGDTTLTPLTPKESFKLDNSGSLVNPFLSNLPTIRPPPISMKAEDVPFDNWLSRVKLPANVRAATSGMELLRAVESKSLELFLSVARVPLAMTANAFKTPPLPPLQLPVFDQTKANQEYDAADLSARLQAESLLRHRLPQGEPRSLLQSKQPHSAELKQMEMGASDVETGASSVETAASDVETGASSVETAASDGEREMQQLGAVDSIMALLGPFLPGGGSLQADSVVADDTYLDELDPHANAVSTSDLLPWLPVDSVAATLPSWLIESLMGPYALLFEDFVRVAQDGFIRMQLVFDTFADEPIPVTARGIELFSEQMAEAFRATPAGDEADALKSIALTVRQLPTFMPNEEHPRKVEGREQSPLLDVYDDWVRQVTRNRRLRTTETADSQNEIRPSVVFLSERTTSDNLPWLPMDEVVAGLPGFYLDKLGKPGKAIKKVAGAWLSGAEKVDKATKSVLDPIISLAGDSKSTTNERKSDRETSQWNSPQSQQWNSPQSQWNSPQSQWERDETPYGGRRTSGNDDAKKKDDSSDNNILDTVGNLLSGFLGQRKSLFLQAGQELENARLGILEGLQVGPVVLNDATTSFVSSVPDVLLSLYDPFPKAEETQRSIESFMEKLEKPTPEAAILQEALADLQYEMENAFKSRMHELQSLLRGAAILPDAATKRSEQSSPLLDLVSLPDIFESSGLPKLTEPPSIDELLAPLKLDELPDLFGLDNPIVLPSVEELDEALRVAQESLERTLLQLGLLPIRLDGQALPSYLVGAGTPSRLFNELHATKETPAKEANAIKETPVVATEETPVVAAEETPVEPLAEMMSKEDVMGDAVPTSDSRGGDVSTSSGGSEGERLGGDDKVFLQMSSLPELYDESFAMYERALQDQWKLIRDYNRFLYQSTLLAPPAPQAAEVSPTSLPAEGSPVSSEGHPDGWMQHVDQPRYTADGVAALFGNLLDSVTYTGGEMLGTFAQRLVPVKGVSLSPSPQVGILSAQIDVSAPQVRDSSSGGGESHAEIVELTDKLKEALARANELIALTERLDSLAAKEAEPPRRLHGGSADPWFIKPEGVGEDDNLTPSQLLIGMLEAANQANYNRMNKVVVSPMKMSIPPALDMRVKLVDIYKQMRNNEQYGNMGLMMNQDLQSFANWAMARNLINRKGRRLSESPEENDSAEADFATVGGDNSLESQSSSESQISSETRTSLESQSSSSVDAFDQRHLEGIFDTLFDLISEGVSDLSRAGDAKSAAKSSAATFIRSISDQIVSSGPSIKEEPEGAAEQMEEKRPHRGEKCVNNSNCRVGGTRVHYSGHRADGWAAEQRGPTPQGSVVLSQSRDFIDDNNGFYPSRSYY